MIYSVSRKTNSKGFEIYDIYIYIYVGRTFTLYLTTALCPATYSNLFSELLKNPYTPYMLWDLRLEV